MKDLTDILKVCDFCGGDNSKFSCPICRNKGYVLDGTKEEIDQYFLTIKELLETMTRILMEAPDSSGNYTHLSVCSGDRTHPPGTYGVSCSCQTGRKLNRDLIRQNHQLRQAFDMAIRLRSPSRHIRLSGVAGGIVTLEGGDWFAIPANVFFAAINGAKP